MSQEKSRRKFIKKLGLVSAASLLSVNHIIAHKEAHTNSNICTLIPTETAGPFPLDLTENSYYFRQDVRESESGIQLNLKLKIFGIDNCVPLSDVRVNIWHCNKEGFYSGYNTTNNAGQEGLTYLRGYQFADSNGEVEFITVFPGWYSPRTCHIHLQVYVSSTYAAISQLTFDETEKNAIYSANSSLYTIGTDPTSPSSDPVLSDGYDYQIATLSENISTGGYDAYLEVGVEGSGTVGLGLQEIRAAKQFSLGQNYPNPFVSETNVPFELKRLSDVTLELWNLSGKKVATINRSDLAPGKHTIPIDLRTLGLPNASYVYQFEVRNNEGVNRLCKMMTIAK